jgi:general secretion pathway protein D
MAPLAALAALFWIALALLAGAPARAEAIAGPASVVSFTVNSAAGETRVLIGFSQILPQFSIVANDARQAVIGFADTVRGPALSEPSNLHGLLKAVVLHQRGGVLTLTLAGVGPIHVVARPASRQTLELVITPAGEAKDPASGAPTGGPPAHADRGPGEDAFEVVLLKYADVSEIVGLLSSGPAIKPNDGFMPQEPAFGSAGFGNNGQAANTLLQQPVNPNDAGALGQMVDDSVGVDRRLNAIVLHGTPERIARLKAKIEALDVPVKSVQLETVFVELTETGARNLGLNLNNTSGQLALATYASGTFLPGGGASPGQASVSLQAALYAQVSQGQGRILSRPRISAQSGSTAKIITGDALPIVTSIALSGVNAVSQQVQYVNVGVTLQIAPRISVDGVVSSHIFAVVSSVTGYSQGYPTISQREASTTATVKDGDYFIIGGLTQENKLQTTSHPPGVNGLPLIGGLFNLHQDTSAKTVLYVIVSPHVVNDADAQIARVLADR